MPVPVVEYCPTCHKSFKNMNIPEGSVKFKCPGCKRIIPNTMYNRCPGCMSLCADEPTYTIHTRYCPACVRTV